MYLITWVSHMSMFCPFAASSVEVNSKKLPHLL